MRALATLAVPGAYPTPGQPLVGRAIANAQLLRALVRHSSATEIALIIGESQDVPALEALTRDWDIPKGRLLVHHVWQLPELLQQERIDCLHYGAHVERLYDLLALRNRWARRATPVTGQIHSLSYPRLHQELARAVFLPPGPTDALFCSSVPGRQAVERAHALVEAAGQERGLRSLGSWQLPHVPLGVDTEALVGGDRTATRERLKIPSSAVLLLGLARFTEYDKADLFPLLHVLERLVHAPTPSAPEVYLLLAGARQGTQTPEMLQLWARSLGIEGRLRLEVDFPESAKRDLLAAADVFVSPVDNIQETFGQSVVEAMAAGLPVVVSDFDGYRDTVDSEVGARVPTRFGVDLTEVSELGPLLYERPLHLLLGQSVEVDLHALEDALRTLSLDRSLREQQGRAAAARAKARYDWRVVIPQMDAEWQRLQSRPWQPPVSRTHPLKLDFDRVFSHFATERISPSRVVERSELSRRSGRPWVIYPELKYLFVDEDVGKVLAMCERSRRVDDLEPEVARALEGRPRWVAGLLITWLLKHGLLTTPS